MQDIVISQNCTVSSKQVAEKFNKRHDDVLKAYRNLRTQSNDLQHADFFQRNFAENNINTLYGKVELAEVSMTRDGFSLVAMGFTGAEALSWKVRFIEAFNAMESALRHHTIHEEPYAQELLDKPKTARITASVEKINTLFGEPIYKRTMVRVEEARLTPLERLQAKRFNLILQAEGCIRKAKKLEAEIDYLQQPASLRLIKS